MQLLDAMMNIPDQLANLVENDENYQRATEQLNKIIHDSTQSPMRRSLAAFIGHNIGKVNTRRKVLESLQAGDDHAAQGFRQMIEEIEKDMNRGNVSSPGEQPDAREAGQVHRAARHFDYGDMVFFIQTDELGVRIVVGRVVAQDSDDICASDTEGLVHWVPREGCYASSLEAARNGVF